MQTATKKPITVEFMQFTEESKQEVYNWIKEFQMNIQPSFDKQNNPILIVPTLEGDMVCALGDYMIKEPFPTDWRKFYPCKPDIFAATYETNGRLIPSLQPRERGHNKCICGIIRCPVHGRMQAE